MEKNQYRIPGQQEQPLHPAPPQQESPLNAALRAADAALYTPETQPEAYRFLHDAADRIHAHFETALENDRTRKVTFIEKVTGTFIGRKQLTMDEVIDMTGELVDGVGSGKRFWLGNRYEHQVGLRGDHNEEVVHWYFEEKIIHPDTNGKLGSHVLHFETRPTVIKKWHNGIPFDPRVEEIQHLAQRVYHYEQQVSAQFDPVDSMLHDLQDEQRQDAEQARRAQEMRVVKPVVDRVIAEYRAGHSTDQKDDYTKAA